MSRTQTGACSAVLKMGVGLPKSVFRITHRFAFDDMPKAYETFSQAASTQALKVIVEI